MWHICAHFHQLKIAFIWFIYVFWPYIQKLLTNSTLYSSQMWSLVLSPAAISTIAWMSSTHRSPILLDTHDRRYNRNSQDLGYREEQIWNPQTSLIPNTPASIWCLGYMLIDSNSQSSMETRSGFALERLWNLTNLLAFFRCTCYCYKNIKIPKVATNQSKALWASLE